MVFKLVLSPRAGGGGGGVLNISHLLFADDTLAFCGVDPDQLCYLKLTLLCFEPISGLKINLSKSEMVPVGEVNLINELDALLGCKVSSFLMTYFGFASGCSLKVQGYGGGKG